MTQNGSQEVKEWLLATGCYDEGDSLPLTMILNRTVLPPCYGGSQRGVKLKQSLDTITLLVQGCCKVRFVGEFNLEGGSDSSPVGTH